MPDDAKVLIDYEFHFANGQMLFVETVEGRDTIRHSSTRIIVEVNDTPQAIRRLVVNRNRLNAWQRTVRVKDEAHVGS